MYLSKGLGKDSRVVIAVEERREIGHVLATHVEDEDLLSREYARTARENLRNGMLM